MDSYEETFTTWNKVALLYEQQFMHLDIYNQSYDVLCELLGSETSRVLELGCGPGNITRYLLQKKPQLHVEGCDVAPDMIALAKKNNPSGHFFVLDVRRLNELNSTYNALVLGFCIPYLSLDDCKKLFYEVYRLLTPGGLLYLSFVDGDPNQSGFVTGSSGHRAYFYYHRKAALIRLLEVLGFHLQYQHAVLYRKENTREETHEMLIAKKPI